MKASTHLISSGSNNSNVFSRICGTHLYGNPFAHLFTRAPPLHKCDRECAKWTFNPNAAHPQPQKVSEHSLLYIYTKYPFLY